MYVANSIWVDDLLAERAPGEVGALWDVENVFEIRLLDCAAVNGPEPAKDAEEGRFPATVRTNNEEVLAWIDGEGEFLNQYIPIWRDDRNIGELD